MRKTRFRPAPSRLPTSSASTTPDTLGNRKSELENVLKRFTTLGEKYTQQAQNLPAPPKEDIQFKVSTPDKNDIFKGVDMDKTKDQLMQVLQSLKAASTVATDLTYHFAGPGGGLQQDEQMDYWFRRQQWAAWNAQLVSENKIRAKTRPVNKTGEKNPAFHLYNSTESTLVGTVVVGSKETHKFVKKLVYQKYTTKDDFVGSMVLQPPPAALGESLLFPVGFFAGLSSPYYFTVCNLMKKDGAPMQIVVIRSRIWEADQEGDYQFRLLDGLFDKGLQAVDLYTDAVEKKGYLLVRGVSSSTGTGHGMAIIDLSNGMVQQWISFSPFLDKYAELYGFVNGLDSIGGLIREFTASSHKPFERSISVSFDRKTQSIAIHAEKQQPQEQQLYTRKRPVAGSDGTIFLASCNLPQYQQTGKNPPQVLIYSNSTIALPDSYHIQHAVAQDGVVLLLGSCSDTGEYLVAQV